MDQFIEAQLETNKKIYDTLKSAYDSFHPISPKRFRKLALDLEDLEASIAKTSQIAANIKAEKERISAEINKYDRPTASSYDSDGEPDRKYYIA